MMKAMLSQPLAGKTDEEIRATREKAIETLKERGYEIVNTLFTDEWYSKEKMEERAKYLEEQGMVEMKENQSRGIERLR